MSPRRREPVRGQAPALLHPVDFAPARRYYLLAMFLQLAASPIILAAAIIFLLGISANLFTPLLGPIVGLSITSYVERRYRADAWAHIARKAQDRTRSDPAPWAQLALTLQLVLLLLAVLGLVQAVRATGQSGAAALGAGILAGLVLVEVASLIWDRRAQAELRSVAVGGSWRILQGLGVLAVALPGAGVLLGFGSLNPWLLLLGVLAQGGTCVLWYVIRMIPATSSCVPKSFPLP